MHRFSIEITVDTGGVRAIRVYGETWEQGSEAYELLRRVGPLIQQLDALAKLAAPIEQTMNSGPGKVQ